MDTHMTPKVLRQALLVTILTLLGLGTIAVYSASAMAAAATYGGSLRFLQHHLVAIAFGTALAVACLMIPYDRLRQSAKWLFLISLVLLVVVCVFGSGQFLLEDPYAIHIGEDVSRARIGVVLHVSFGRAHDECV